MSGVEIGSVSVACLSLLLAVFFWRRATSLHHILTNTVASSDEIQNQLYRLQGEINKKKELLNSRAEKLKASEAQLRQLNTEAQLSKSAADAAEARRSEVETRANILIERYKEEAALSEKDCALAKSQAFESKEKLAAAKSGGVQALKAEQERHKETARILKAKLSEQDSLYQNLDAQMKKVREKWVDPAELLRLKKKLAGYQRVQQVLKGQKDMAEERLENWNSALLKLSAWVLKRQQRSVPGDQTQCVMAALDAAQIALVHDEFQAPKTSASRKQEQREVVL